MQRCANYLKNLLKDYRLKKAKYKQTTRRIIKRNVLFCFLIKLPSISC